jgi:hypothetical protein
MSGCLLAVAVSLVTGFGLGPVRFSIVKDEPK